MSESLSLDSIPWMEENSWVENYNPVGVSCTDMMTSIVRLPRQCWTAKKAVLDKFKIYAIESPTDVIVVAKKKDLFTIVSRNGYEAVYIEYPNETVEIAGLDYVVRKILPWLVRH